MSLRVLFLVSWLIVQLAKEYGTFKHLYFAICFGNSDHNSNLLLTMSFIRANLSFSHYPIHSHPSSFPQSVSSLPSMRLFLLSILLLLLIYGSHCWIHRSFIPTIQCPDPVLSSASFLWESSQSWPMKLTISSLFPCFSAKDEVGCRALLSHFCRGEHCAELIFEESTGEKREIIPVKCAEGFWLMWAISSVMRLFWHSAKRSYSILFLIQGDSEQELRSEEQSEEAIQEDSMQEIGRDRQYRG